MNIQVSFSIDDEIRYVQGCLRKADFYRQHGYVPILPDDVQLGDSWSLAVEEKTRQDIHRHRSSYDAAAAELLLQWEEQQSKISSVFKKWKFPVPKTVTVKLTRYGPGGSYYPPATVLLRLDLPSMCRSRLEVLVHEIVHLSIEEPIIQKFKLSQGEKESLVDYFFTQPGLHELFSDYQMRKFFVAPTLVQLQTYGLLDKR